MSSGNVQTDHPELYLWSEHCCESDYVFVTYQVVSLCSAETTAVGMAMEQSVTTVRIPGYVASEGLGRYTARVREVSSLEMDCREFSSIAAFRLPTHAYTKTGTPSAYHIEIGFPLLLLQGGPANWFNVLLGELPRLGFITALRVSSVDFGESIGGGPRGGRRHILRTLELDNGPLLCRSTRPAVGIDVETQIRINFDVLTHGFHAVKDDELMSFADNNAFNAHIRAMVDTRDRAADRAGERKLYMANLICEPDQLDRRIEAAEACGVDGVLVAPAIQGFSTVSAVASRAEMSVFAHNTFMDFLTRNPAFGIHDAVMAGLLRRLGADWIATPGSFATPAADPADEAAVVAAICGSVSGLEESMPVLMGGKNPDELPRYIKSANGPDFMLIVATWVDEHQRGLCAGVRQFREALDAMHRSPSRCG